MYCVCACGGGGGGLLPQQGIIWPDYSASNPRGLAQAAKSWEGSCSTSYSRVICDAQCMCLCVSVPFVLLNNIKERLKIYFRPYILQRKSRGSLAKALKSIFLLYNGKMISGYMSCNSSVRNELHPTYFCLTFLNRL